MKTLTCHVKAYLTGLLFKTIMPVPNGYGIDPTDEEYCSVREAITTKRPWI